MKILRNLLFMFLLPVVAFAENGSAYSRIGVGELRHFHTARRMALGELGTALFDQNNISVYNPASWTRLTFTRFEVGLNYTGLYEQDANNKSYYDYADFSGFVIGVPLQREWGMTFVTGIAPFSTVRYNIITPNVLQQNDVYKGDGGISKIYAGLSYKLPFDLSVGAILNYYTGTMSYYTNLETLAGEYAEMQFKRTYKIFGLGGSVGLISPNLNQSFNISGVDDLRLGVTFDFNNPFDVDTSLSVSTSSGGTQDLGTGISTLQIPYKLSAGLTAAFNKTNMILVDYLYQPWSNYDFAGVPNTQLQDLNKISAGYEYLGTPGQGYWSQIPLRVGVSYEQTQYKVTGKSINLFSVYAGFSIPLDVTSSIDLGFQYGMRGTTESNLLKENIFKFNTTINFGELWFLRSR